MAYSRPDDLPDLPDPGELTARMAGIGMNFAAEARSDDDIELTLVYASEVGMEEGDLRVLSVLTTWMGVHRTHVNVDRLVRFVSRHPSERVKAYWSAIGNWLGKDRRYTHLASGYEGAAIDLLPVGTAYQLARRGEDERFTGSKLRVPRGSLRDRPEDVLTPELLIARHAGYRNRVLLGPSWRADVWTVLERERDLSVSEIARQVSCSFAAAWRATQDFRLLRRADRTAG